MRRFLLIVLLSAPAGPVLAQSPAPPSELRVRPDEIVFGARSDDDPA